MDILQKTLNKASSGTKKTSLDARPYFIARSETKFKERKLNNLNNNRERK